MPAFILGLARRRGGLPVGLAGLNNAGPHGFSEMLYAYTSGAATNGSAFAGLNANTPFYNLTLAAAMFAGRFLVIVPVLCIAGTLGGQAHVPPSAGTLPTHGMQFVGLLVGTILIVGGLTFFPALALGPIAEHFAMQAGTDLLMAHRRQARRLPSRAATLLWLAEHLLGYSAEHLLVCPAYRTQPCTEDCLCCSAPSPTALRGGFLIRPFVIALALGVAGGVLSSLEEQVPTLGAWVPMTLFPSRQDPQVAQVILSAIATSIMTVVSIVFAILLMTLTLASTQFSPRILVSFVRDRGTQWTLGVFLGTFSYCMAALPAARSLPVAFVPVLTVTGAMVLALVAVGWLIFFIHHISQAISVNHIVDRIARETELVIDELMPRPRSRLSQVVRTLPDDPGDEFRS